MTKKTNGSTDGPWLVSTLGVDGKRRNVKSFPTQHAAEAERTKRIAKLVASGRFTNREARPRVVVDESPS